MTTEVLRNMLYVGSTSLADLGYVVMDEVHYLGDRFRGARLGGGHHPPAGGGAAGLAVGDGVQRRGVRRVAGLGARRDPGDRPRAAAGAAVAARARRLAGCSTCSREDGAHASTRSCCATSTTAPATSTRAPTAVAAAAGAARLAPAAPPGRDRPARPRGAAARDHVHLQPGRLRRRGAAVRARRAVADRRGRAGGDRRGHRRAHRDDPGRGPRRAGLLGVARRAAARAWPPTTPA